MSGNSKFVHPKDLGLDFPINTREELCQVAKALNGGINRANQNTKEMNERKLYAQLKEKYGK